MKGPIIVAVLLIVLVVGYTAITMNPQDNVVEEQKPFKFDFSVNQYGLIDSDDKVRGYATARVVSQSAENATLEMILLPDEAKTNIYKVTDYMSSMEKQNIMRETESYLSKYNIRIDGGGLEQLREKEDAVIIITSDAIPNTLTSGNLSDLIEDNVVVFFGKPLDIGLDISSSQELIGNELYEELGVNYDGKISPTVYGPKVSIVGNATILQYDDGWLVIYEDEKVGKSELGELIIKEGWQLNRAENEYSLGEMNGAKTFFTPPAETNDYHLRIIYSANSENESKTGMTDLPLFQNEHGILTLNENSRTGSNIAYSFELHDDLEYPIYYELSLQFVKDGQLQDEVPAKSVTMKTFARESGYASPNITAGSYIVNLVDSTGQVHASAYTKIPELKVRLVRISSNLHTFIITKDGDPVPSVPITLIVNEKQQMELYTDENGEAATSFVLAPGTHNFTVDLDGQRAITYYRKTGDDFGLLSYAALILGSVFFVAVIILKSKEKRKWAIKTYNRPPTISKTLKIPYDVFLQLFKMTQDNRAKGLPLSVSDLKIGLRKYATFRGAPLFVTESNLYLLIDKLAKKGRFLSYGGYFLPADASQSKPIEYWVLKRRISDYFVEHGEELKNSDQADFLVRGKLVHIWHDLDPKKLVKLCKKTDNVIIFPDKKSKNSFKKMVQQYDPEWMKLALELQYGKLYCETLDEFLERGFRGKN